MLESQHQFRPELLNRVDDIGLFKALTETEIERIARPPEDATPVQSSPRRTYHDHPGWMRLRLLAAPRLDFGGLTAGGA